MNKMLTVAILTILLISCKRDTDQIPNVLVDITIYTSDPQWINLSSTGGWEYISGGSKGIILFRTSPTEFMAYERHCPYQAEENCSISVDESLISASDSTCCVSSFNLYNGAVNSGPSTFPLKAYQTTFDGEILFIRN
jgi:nitrite reductase/ring-hydroxylating ferredoxin subunit